MTALMLNPLEALHLGELNDTTDRQHSDIATYRLNWPRGQFSENLAYMEPLNLLKGADISTDTTAL